MSRMLFCCELHEDCYHREGDVCPYTAQAHYDIAQRQAALKAERLIVTAARSAWKPREPNHESRPVFLGK